MGLVTCPDCHNSISDSATSCPHCGRPLKAKVGSPVQPQHIVVEQKKKTSPVTWGCLILIAGTLLFGLVGIMLSQCGSRTTANKTSSPTPKAEPKLTSTQRLKAAKKALEENYQPNKDPMKTTWGNVEDAQRHLKAIATTDPEFKEAEKLSKEVERRKKEINKVAAIVVERMAVTERTNFAKDYENALLNKGMDVHVVLSGKQKTTLTLKYILMNRALAHQLANDSQWVTKVRTFGFKKVIFTNGYNDSWSYEF